ncbi:helix-turn-helix domain-containing protein [Bacillus pumilus]|uniref:helix-turn-helix domain-containing protein n=1 Tax=Bacillus pumilus TaxID=1408 RepID=UPI0011E8F0BE|nr:Rgg/GadR/MutR family transcriptional regulator [Bacillus pumilus]TYS32982.1 hypothetical protein FZC65_06325 [Bacillus pumilus]TYS50685.1 hypothetical protein FZC67_04900 [Bacillus pumilus]
MLGNIGRTMRSIRKNKGYTQHYVSSGLLSQSAYSKFELHRIDILASSYMALLEKVDVSLDEFYYIMNDFQYTRRQKFINDFFNTTFNHPDKLRQLIMESEKLLSNSRDQLISDIQCICTALIVLNETGSIEQARNHVDTVWERLSKHENWYLVDIRLINSLLFIFPIETAMHISRNALKRLNNYKNFQDAYKIEINIRVNFSLLLIKYSKFKSALDVLEAAIPLCKKHGAYREMAICYGRKGICLKNLNMVSYEEYTEKATKVLRILEEKKLEEMLNKEIRKYYIKK